MDSTCILAVLALFVAFGLWRISSRLRDINETLKGLPGWKEYHEPETEVQKVDLNNLSVHLPKK